MSKGLHSDIEQIHRALGRLEGDANSIRNCLQDFKHQLLDFQKHLHHLEKQMTFWKGGISLLPILGGVLGSYISLIFKVLGD